MYSNIKSSISLNGNISEPFISEIGVRQGENLSPLLFSLFLNDLQTHMHLQGSVGIELTNPIDLTLWRNYSYYFMLMTLLFSLTQKLTSKIV